MSFTVFWSIGNYHYHTQLERVLYLVASVIYPILLGNVLIIMTAMTQGTSGYYFHMVNGKNVSCGGVSVDICQILLISISYKAILYIVETPKFWVVLCVLTEMTLDNWILHSWIDAEFCPVYGGCWQSSAKAILSARDPLFHHWLNLLES
jgi:hypothetical protein